jgi:hypothetical protein
MQANLHIHALASSIHNNTSLQYIHIYVYAYVYVYICIHTYITHKDVYILILRSSTCIHVYVHISKCIWIHTYMTCKDVHLLILRSSTKIYIHAYIHKCIEHKHTCRHVTAHIHVLCIVFNYHFIYIYIYIHIHTYMLTYMSVWHVIHPHAHIASKLPNSQEDTVLDGEWPQGAVARPLWAQRSRLMARTAATISSYSGVQFRSNSRRPRHPRLRTLWVVRPELCRACLPGLWCSPDRVSGGEATPWVARPEPCRECLPGLWCSPDQCIGRWSHALRVSSNLIDDNCSFLHKKQPSNS